MSAKRQQNENAIDKDAVHFQPMQYVHDLFRYAQNRIAVQIATPLTVITTKNAGDVQIILR